MTAPFFLPPLLGRDVQCGDRIVNSALSIIDHQRFCRGAGGDRYLGVRLAQDFNDDEDEDLSEELARYAPPGGRGAATGVGTDGTCMGESAAAAGGVVSDVSPLPVVNAIN